MDNVIDEHALYACHDLLLEHSKRVAETPGLKLCT
jgi:hypothetical protein